MQLLNEKIKYFTFEGHRFENLATVEEKQDVSKNNKQKASKSLDQPKQKKERSKTRSVGL